ncbi:MAG: HEAT repeat domain-containing protein [Thermodesulfovibrionales bacterium]|nr:HEAT repeat domain-containing protein [Thermodesulfovibrionales bacterium]
METPEDVKLAKDIVQVFVKGKKNLRMYPSNNPIYAKTIEEAARKLDEFFSLHDELKLRIKQNELLVGTDAVYSSASKDENLALFFFKDGLRELTIHKGISAEELQRFIEVLAFDFEREDVEDDVVTLLWEKDFQSIKYMVDDTVLTEDEDYEREAIRQTKDAAPEEDNLQRAYDDAFTVEEEKASSLLQITDKDLKALIKDLERDSYDKREKLLEILYDMLYHADSPGEYKDIVGILTEVFEFSISHGDFAGGIGILRKAQEMSSASITDDQRGQLNILFLFAGSHRLIKIIGELLDNGTLTDEALLSEYTNFLDKSAIPSFMTVLGELKAINARKLVIGALTTLGRKDISTLAKGLMDDRWYVVRNIIYILRMIGDKRAVEFLTKAVRHDDTRVRKEVLKALGELGAQGAAQTIRECLDDPDPSVRTSAVRALSAVGSDYAKRVLFEGISHKGFMGLDFAEKKEYFEALAHWKDAEVFDFLIRTVRKNTLFRKAKNDENRACAAYGLGLFGSKDALSALHRIRDSKNKLLSEYAYSAIRRIEYGR